MKNKQTKKTKILIILNILTLFTLTTQKSTESLQNLPNPSPSSAASFCGKRIHSGLANDVLTQSAHDLLQDFINRYNSIVNKTNSDFPLIPEPDHGFTSLANKMIKNPPQFTRIKTKYDFFTIYIYILRHKKNVKMMFSIKPHNNDLDNKIIKKFSDFEETEGNMYSYLYPSFEDMIEKTGLTAGFYSFERSYLFEDHYNFEVELCMNFYVFINKLTRIWRRHNEELREGKVESVVVDGFEFVKEREEFDRDGRRFEDFRSMIYEKNSVCLLGEKITFFTMVNGEVEESSYEEEDYSESGEEEENRGDFKRGDTFGYGGSLKKKKNFGKAKYQRQENFSFQL